MDCVVFLRDLSMDEFKAFLSCLEQDPDRLNAEGGAHDSLRGGEFATLS
jgi:hypothetical protein